MAFTHGKDTIVTLDGNDISDYSNSTDFNNEADSHDTTCYGKEAHTFEGGLKNGTVSLQGMFDTAAGTGPRDTIQALIGTKVVFLFQPEGVGSGKAQSTGDVLVLNYNESAPVNEMVTWKAELQNSDIMNHTPQA